MHRNGRVIKLSQLPSTDYTLPARESGWRPTIVCPDCGTHRTIARTLIHPHRADDGVTRCSGSGTRIVFDMTTEGWELALRQAEHATEVRRANWPLNQWTAIVPKPLHRIAADRLATAR